jgi:N-acetylmuramidase
MFDADRPTAALHNAHECVTLQLGRKSPKGAAMTIRGSVGVGALNAQEDVMFVQLRIFFNRHWLDAVPWVQANGNCGVHTIAAIKKFQATAGALYKDDCDGIVLPRGFMIQRLEMAYIPKPQHRVFVPLCWNRTQGGLTRDDFVRAATTLGCEAAAIRAVARQEAGRRGAWDSLGRPAILYERHKFAEYSGNIWNQTHRDISSTRQSTNSAQVRDRYGGYDYQYEKLYRAATLNEAAALKSTSWGLFQMLGDKYAASGFATVGAFVDAMLESESRHLDIFVAYINGNAGLKKAIQDKNWARFALLYNGKSYAQNQYDVHMANYYRQYAAEEAARTRPRARVRR